MKKYLLIAFLLCFGAVQAQDILITDSAGTIWNGDTIEYEQYMSTANAANNGFTLKFQKAFIKNNSNHTLEVKVKRTAGSTQAGITGQICWGGVCEGEQSPFLRTRTTILSATMQPQQEIEGGATGFAGYYLPKGNYGVTYFEYTFYDTNNTVPSAFFTVKFNATQSVGLEEHNRFSNFSISPNPASEYIELNKLPKNISSSLQVEVLNIIGKVVAEKVISNEKANQRLEISHLLPGIYFVRIRSDNKYSETQKLIVK